MYRRQLGSTLLLLAALGALSACGEQQPAINRVEPYALEKSLFAGEWFFGQTVVEVPGTNTVNVTGNTNGVYRIRWDIQENHLYARKSDELIEGAKGTDTQTGEYKGTIVGGWKILKHFDLKRTYNPTTGEESNVLEQNTTDCKWYDCKYLRVDWSENLAIDYSFLDSEENIQKTAMPFYDQDAHDPRWRPVFDPKNGYIDVTTSLVVKPVSYHLRTWDLTVPLCWYEENMECTPEVLKVRNSFWRRDPNRDFEPREHAGPHDEWFGYFVSERLAWENHYGVSYKTKKKLINRHNLWTFHHYDNADSTCQANMPREDACQTDKDCQDRLKDPSSTCGATTKTCLVKGDQYCARTFGAGSRCDTLMRFHKFEVSTDSDGDGLPDSFEAAAGLDPQAADSNRNGTPDAQDDQLSFGPDGIARAGNGKRDQEDFWAWDSANLEHRCTIPMADREPVPVAYFNTGFFPRSYVCDEDRGNVTRDKVGGPCRAWSFLKPADREKSASTLHSISLDYDESFFWAFLRGVWGFSVDEYNDWIGSHDVSRLTDANKQAIVRKFGDDEHGYYAFTICPNNPVQETDPWPCRFPHLTFARAKELMDQGRSFGTTDERGKEVAPYVRHGDLRYSMVNYVKDYYDGYWALLGLGPSMTDPVTGENLAGVANVYAYNDTVATEIQEKVMLLNGQIAPNAFVDGVDLKNYFAKLKQSEANELAGVGSSRVYSPAQMKSLHQGLQQPWLQKVPREGDRRALFAQLRLDDAGRPLSSKAFKQRLLERMAQKGGLQKQGKLRDLSVVAGTPLEKLLVDDDEVLRAAGVAPGAAQDLTADVLKKASLARGGFVRMSQALRQLRAELAHKRSMDFVGLADAGLDSVAGRLKNLPPEQVWVAAREIVMRAALTHEMGHTVGLHHNWSGTDDALNFFDEYWKLRSEGFTRNEACKADGSNKDTAICPFSISPMTASMRSPGGGKKGLYEYAYSSVMDYNAKYHDSTGLGKYDRAAIMFGHVDKVEVFEKWGKIPAPSADTNVFEEWYSSSANPFWIPPPLYNLTSFHYTKWFGLMGKLAFDDHNRKIVDYREVKVKDGGWSFVDPTGTTLPRVPYAFCSYTHGDLGDNCNTFDYGADHFERMRGDLEDWESWYVMRAFPRYRYGDGLWRGIYYGYDRLKQYNDNYALNKGFLSAWIPADEMETFMTDRVNGWGNYTIAVHEGFNLAMRTLAMPDVKTYELLTKPDGQKVFAETEFQPTYRSDLSNARYFSSAWKDSTGADSCGLNWWECLHHHGFYLDKIWTLFTLADPMTRYAGVDTSEDIREWRIGFFENWSKQLVDFFGGVLAEDHDAIAPWIDPSKPKDAVVVDAGGVTWSNQMAWRNYGDPSLDPQKPASGGSVEAATRFTFQVYAAVLGMLLFQDNFDNEFVERGRIWKKGKDTTWTVKPVVGKIDGVAEFDDPVNGSTYVGIAYTDGRGIAQRMIKHANKLKQHTSWCNQTPGLADSCEAIPTSFGCDQTCMRQKAEEQLYKYRQLLDVMIQISTLYNNSGGTWSWDPYDP